MNYGLIIVESIIAIIVLSAGYSFNDEYAVQKILFKVLGYLILILIGLYIIKNILTKKILVNSSGIRFKKNPQVVHFRNTQDQSVQQFGERIRGQKSK